MKKLFLFLMFVSLSAFATSDNACRTFKSSEHFNIKASKRDCKSLAYDLQIGLIGRLPIDAIERQEIAIEFKELCIDARKMAKGDFTINHAQRLQVLTWNLLATQLVEGLECPAVQEL